MALEPAHGNAVRRSYTGLNTAIGLTSAGTVRDTATFVALAAAAGTAIALTTGRLGLPSTPPRDLESGPAAPAA